jgi:synaptosomal-associated protein 29
LIQESENVGIQTAVELDRQREQLEKTKNNLDKIDVNLKESQKDINSMKSVFYRMKYAFSSKKKIDPVTTELPSSSSSDKKPVQLRAESQDDRYNSHPTTRLRGDNSTAKTTKRTVDDEYENQLDDHLDQISDGLSRLKDLALNLGTEVEAHNELLDDIGTKMNGVDGKIEDQNKAVSKMLGKKDTESTVPSVTSASTTFKILKFFK